MGTLKRGIIGAACAAAIATGAIAAFAASGTPSAPQPTTSVDVKGLCDEVEHANDPRCDGVQVPEDGPGAGVNAANDDGPNHDANDDHGGGKSGPSNNSGHSRGRDHSGSDDNSGPGSSPSGPGSSGGDD